MTRQRRLGINGVLRMMAKVRAEIKLKKITTFYVRRFCGWLKTMSAWGGRVKALGFKICNIIGVDVTDEEPTRILALTNDFNCSYESFVISWPVDAPTV